MTVPESPAPRRVLWPWEYYSSATPDPVLPRWATFGCGAASVVLLAIIFAGGVWLRGGGFTTLLDLTLGMTMGELRGAYTDDVAERRRKSLDDEVAELRRNFREGRVSAAALQPFLRALRAAMLDGEVTAEEAARIEEAARRINEPATPAR